MLHTRFIRPRLLCIAVTACVLTSVGCSAGNESGADSKPTDKTSRPAAGKKPTGPEGSFSILTYNVAGLPEPISGSSPATSIRASQYSAASGSEPRSDLIKALMVSK